MSVVQLIGALVGSAISAYLLTGFTTLFMRSGLKGIDKQGIAFTKARNAIWFKASIGVSLILSAAGINQIAQGASVAYGFTFVVGGLLVVWEFWRRPRG